MDDGLIGTAAPPPVALPLQLQLPPGTPGVGGGAAVPPPAAPPPAAPPPAAPPLPAALLPSWGNRHLEQLVLVALIGVQTVIWMRTAETPGEHLNQATLTSLYSVVALLAFYASPCFWRQWRVAVLSALRVAVWLVPCSRSTREGIAAVLRRPATPGLLGVLIDYLRMSAGTRVTPRLLAGVIMQQPPLVLLLQQALTFNTDTRNSVGYCRSQLLSDPLSRRRLAAAGQLLDMAPVLLSEPLHASAAGTNAAAEARRGELMCVASVNLHTVVFTVIVPMFVVACFRPHPSAEQQQQLQRRQELQQRQAGQGAAASSWRRGVEAAARLLVTVDSELCRVCRDPPMPATQLAVIFLVLMGNLWLICTAVAARALAANPPSP